MDENKTEKNCNEIMPLDDQLKCLREQLLEWQSTYQKADSKIKEREAQIEALGSFIGEFDKIVSEYKEKQPELEKKQAMYKDSCEKLTKCLESVLGEECYKKVCEIVCAIKKELTDLGAAIDADKNSLVEAKKQKEEAEKNKDDAKNAFDLLKSPIKSIEARFKLLDPLLKEIELEKNANPTIAYYLLKCKEKYCDQVENGKPEVYKPDVFKDKLQEAWKKYRSADSVFNEKDTQVKSLEKTLETKGKQLDAEKKDLETKIRRKLVELANSSACSNQKKESSDYHCD
jgi:hypothetical protein